eukprot:4800088-Prymnesium_polylepis.1
MPKRADTKSAQKRRGASKLAEPAPTELVLDTNGCAPVANRCDPSSCPSSTPSSDPSSRPSSEMDFSKMLQMAKSTKSTKTATKEPKVVSQSRTSAVAKLIFAEATSNEKVSAYLKIETIHNRDGSGFIGAVDCGPNYTLASGTQRVAGAQQRYPIPTLPDISICKLTGVNKDDLVKATHFELPGLYVTMGTNAAELVPAGGYPGAKMFGNALQLVQSPIEVGRSEFRTGPIAPWKAICNLRARDIATAYSNESENFEPDRPVAGRLRDMMVQLKHADCKDLQKAQEDIQDVLDSGHNRLSQTRDVAAVGGNYL